MTSPTPTPSGARRTHDASNVFHREPRYLVVKIKDANAYLSRAERETLETIGSVLIWFQVAEPPRVS